MYLYIKDILCVDRCMYVFVSIEKKQHYFLIKVKTAKRTSIYEHFGIKMKK